MVNRDRAWSLWLLPTRPALQAGNRGPQSPAHPMWTKAVIPRILSHGWILLGLGSSSAALRRDQNSINIQQMAALSLGSERWGLGKRVPPCPSSAELRGAGPLGQPSSVVYLLYAILRCHEPNAHTPQEGTVDQRLIQMSTRFSRSVDE